jgi:hypothetical protein
MRFCFQNEANHGLQLNNNVIDCVIERSFLLLSSILIFTAKGSVLEGGSLC